MVGADAQFQVIASRDPEACFGNLVEALVVLAAERKRDVQTSKRLELHVPAPKAVFGFAEVKG